MATSSYAKSLLGGLNADMKAAFYRVMEYVFDGTFAFGPVSHQARTTNLAGVYVKVTTSTSAGIEFTVAHGLGRKPNVIIPVLPPLVVGAKLVGDLTVSRAADESRLYFTSAGSTGAVTYLYVE